MAEQPHNPKTHAERYKFFNHAACEFYPCHDMPAEQLNCLFCYCPLYCLGRSCGGNFTYIGDVKDCSACTVPHRVENYDYIMSKYDEVKDIAARTDREAAERVAGAPQHLVIGAESSPSHETLASAADTSIRVVLLAGGDEEAACALAEKVGAELARDRADTAPDDLVVLFDAEGVSLIRGELSMRADLTSMLPRMRPGKLSHELLVRAAKIKGSAALDEPLRVVDATAGLGEDSLLLAAAGFDVQLYERDPVIAALLADSLRRAREHPQLAKAVERMHLAGFDSVAAMPQLDVAPDVVYLDPMFPERRKSAAVKKKFQLIHYLERPCDDQEALVRAALAAHPRKIVIKRPIKGPFLAGMKPSYSLTGKSVRYDCIVPPQSTRSV